jgi:hypothetical protein
MTKTKTKVEVMNLSEKLAYKLQIPYNWLEIEKYFAGTYGVLATTYHNGTITIDGKWFDNDRKGEWKKLEEYVDKLPKIGDLMRTEYYKIYDAIKNLDTLQERIQLPAGKTLAEVNTIRHIKSMMAAVIKAIRANGESLIDIANILNEK